MPRKKIDFGFTPSEYQERIFDFVQHGVGNAVIRAFAGSGKSSTMVAAMKLIPKNRRCLFIAFNKSIVEELSQKLIDYPNCTVKTIHSLGYSMIQHNLEEAPALDEYKYRKYLKNNFCSLSSIDCESINSTVAAEYIDSVSALIDFARFNLCQTVKEIEEIAAKYNIPYYHDECNTALKCLEWGKKNLDTVDYTDMVWLPYELSLSPKGNQFDWVMFDEAQDASKASVDLFKRTFKRGTRFIVVADTFQAINLFAGSSIDAFDEMCSYPNTQLFDLPICYRCGKTIVELAQTIVPEIQWRDDANAGVILEDCHLSDVQDGDMILSRSKAPLIKLYNTLIKRGVNCYIKGSDIGKNLINLINSVNAKEIGRALYSDGLFIRLYQRMIDERNNVMSKYGLDISDASLSTSVLNLYDEINSIISISDGCNSIDEIIEKINNIFQDDSQGVCLSTIHKAKGLECDNVFIICRSTMPPKNLKFQWQEIQERNLIYVAYTRAKNKLGFISEVEVPPTGSQMNDDAIINDIAFIEKQVCQVFGTPMTEDNGSSDFAKFRLKAATKIESLHFNDNVKIFTKKESPNNEPSLDDLLSELD